MIGKGCLQLVDSSFSECQWLIVIWGVFVDLFGDDQHSGYSREHQYDLDELFLHVVRQMSSGEYPLGISCA